MKKIVILASFIVLLFTSCDDTYNFKLKVDNKTTLDKKITITLSEKNNKIVDKVQYYIDSKEIESNGNSLTINTSDFGLGKHQVSALIFYPGKSKKTNNSFEVFANKKPIIYDYEIVNTFPHDINAYTQGLEFKNGFLYESTGRHGQSSLRKVDIKTGKVLQKVKLEDKYFGEGITIVNDKIIWLTWQSNKGFVYDLKTFKYEGEFKYQQSKEGWGLTQNETELIKSDGTHKIWFLDKKSQKEKRAIQTYTHDRALSQLNELEFINGKLYANYYQKPVIAIINPINGVVEGLINLKGLEADMRKTQELVENDEVLNGIAYDPEKNRLFVTGKNWGNLYEIKLTKK
ncbi:glutaminyl-peptide cyclotransferase [Polaribacter sp.]|uniref:glutaminyl-peptide cyclotransferase n=1 Tax=Polaribacter sp. TaxID=1920175 RepID=UPI0025E715E6|nr:glutaminyl-peptide cyclotransferase [Polaribacter sp.]